MTALVSPQLSRLLALLILGLLLLALWQLIVQPTVVQQERILGEIEQKGLLLSNYRRLADTLPDLERQEATVRREWRASAGFLTGENEALASADLQKRVQNAIKRDGGTLQSIQTLPPSQEGKFVKIGIRFLIKADIVALQRILYRLESQTPYLFFNSLQVRATNHRVQNEAQDLEIRGDAFGFMRPSAP